uniref:Importin subunit beta-3 n=1 Tax=Zeugodacus cucurbitae TaxID=28588 RepID=A0A0A1WF61_ZEUCU
MSTEDEFLNWLRRSEQSFLDNFKFALKAWSSAEFTLSSKYDIVLNWLSTEAVNIPLEQMPFEEFTELLQMRAQPGLIAQATKKKFVEMIIQLASKWSEDNKLEKNYAWSKLLYHLCDFEVLQDLYRTDYKIHARVYSTLLNCYELHLTQFKSSKGHINSTTTKIINAANETKYFANIVGNLRDHIKRTGDTARYDKFYRSYVLQPLVRVILTLRTHSLCFFDELLQLERLLTDELQDEPLVQRVMQLPLFVRLLTLECALVNRRGVESFIQHLLQLAFKELGKEIEKVEQKHSLEAPMMITAAAYTLEILRKHDISLNFKMDLENQPAAMTYLGEELFKCIQHCKQDHLREVLMLLCAALRLNPLILEQDIFQITTWMIAAEKKDQEEHVLFGEYLVSLMDMFRRLSRAEKLVFNMLKSLKEWLSKFEIVSNRKTEKKLKRKSMGGDENAVKKSKPHKAALDSDINYLSIIFEEFHNVSTDINFESSTEDNNSFPYLRAAWPSKSVGVAFSKLITGLVSKPSLVIWKSLLYSLRELLQKIEKESDSECDENNQFLLDLHSALLCQYFSGCRLGEQYDKFSKEINGQIQITEEVLSEFARLLLKQEHNERKLNALLEFAFHTSNFKLLLHYYRPDGHNDKSPVPEGLHAFLNTEEWKLLQERVNNFGKSQSKFLYNRLMLQRAQALSLLKATVESNIDLKSILSLTSVDNWQSDVTLLLQKMPSMKWTLSRMNQQEKASMLPRLLDTKHEISVIADDLDSLEILAIAVCARFSQLFATAAKGSILSALNCDFDTLNEYIRADQNAADKKLLNFMKIIETHAQSEYKVKKLPAHEEIEKVLHLSRQLPLGHLRRQSKCLIFALFLAFYSDLSVANNTEINNYASEVFEIILDFLHFGQHVPIFKYFSLSTILQIIPVAKLWQFYEYIFSTIKSEEKGSEQFLTSLAENLEIAESSDSKLSDDQRRLLLIAIETLAAISGPSAKRIRKHFDRILAIYSKYITIYFNKQAAKGSDASLDNSAKKDKKFVEKTLAGFAPFANSVLANAATGLSDGDDKSAVSVDENFRRICKIYIGHSMDYRNPYAIRLLQVALNHRQILHLDQDEIEFVLSHYWEQLNADLKNTSINEANTCKTTETAVKMIIGNKTNEDLLLTLQSLTNNLDDIKDFRNVLRCLELIAKCSFSTIKGAIFNDKFKSITCNIILRLGKDEHQQFLDKEQVLAILAAQQSLVENKMIPISTDTLDDILSLLMDINIKQFPLSENNLETFKQLHCAMCGLFSSLIRQRHVLLMDRVPQFMHIFKDLVQSIVWYKSDRQKDAALSANELDDLAELAMKLEALMHLIATHSVHVKRVAPFILTFVISLIVANKRATTLYPKIKTHIDNICYDLIGICDHRVGRFILRCSNEAARQVYELYVKDHKKYHKFKGKV